MQVHELGHPAPELAPIDDSRTFSIMRIHAVQMSSHAHIKKRLTMAFFYMSAE
jgi:hypothetical protein